MRRIFIYMIAGMVVSGASSCKKDWLDVTSRSQIRAEDQFKSEVGFRDALMGVYIGMTDPAMYAKDMTWNLVDLLSQQYNTLPNPGLYSDVQQFKYKSTRGMPQVNAMWNKTYNVIANINSVLGYIDKDKSILHPISYSIIKGELLGLRAFLHFDLMRLYGYGNITNRPEVAAKPAIPYVSQFSKDITPQLSYDKTFELLKNDINAAIELLKEDPIYKLPGRPANYYDNVNRNGFFNKREQRMNYYGAKALLARVLAWQGGATNKAAARAVAEEVISAAPAKLITPATSPASDRILYVEHLFNLNVNGFQNIIKTYFNADQATNYDALFLLTQNAQSLYETNVGNIGVVDKRFNTLLESQTRGMAPVKLAQRQNGIVNIMPLMKVPEMYYIAAEDYIETDLPKAITYINLVRKSRGIVQDIPAGADKATVADELFKEYRKEFISEGQLFFYFKRTGRVSIPGLSVGTIADDKIYLLPYPDSEIEFGNRVQ